MAARLAAAVAAAARAGSIGSVHWVLRLVEERFHRDVEGRPIREGRTPPEHLRPGEIEYRTCPYEGSRLHHANPMNVSALKQTGAHFDEIVDALALIRSAYGEACGRYGPDLMDLWRVSQLGSALPWFFIFRDEGVPAYAAALAKATLGTGILSLRLVGMTLGGWRAPPLNAQTVLDLAEMTHTLIGHSEVCSAGAKMIVMFHEPLCGDAPEVKGSGEVGKLVPLRRDMLQFGACYVALKLALWVYHHARRFLYADLAADGQGPPELAELLAAPVEPPDCFRLEPPNPAAVPAALRAAWLHQLASLIVPIAPDGADRAIAAAVHRMADAIGEGGSPHVIYGKLDALFAEIAGRVEAGLRGKPDVVELDAAERDRLLIASPRAMFVSLAERS